MYVNGKLITVIPKVSLKPSLSGTPCRLVNILTYLAVQAEFDNNRLSWPISVTRSSSANTLSIRSERPGVKHERKMQVSNKGNQVLSIKCSSSKNRKAYVITTAKSTRRAHAIEMKSRTYTDVTAFNHICVVWRQFDIRCLLHRFKNTNCVNSLN